MTEHEAIEILITLKGTGAINVTEIEAIDLIDESMLELEQYRAIGTVEECKEAMEKQKAVKPVTYKETNIADCPVCGATVRGISKKFGDWCSKCGQKLDWSGEE